MQVAAKEIMDKIHSFLATVSITIGQTRGEVSFVYCCYARCVSSSFAAVWQTCLPLPPLDAMATSGLNNKDRVHLLEGAVMTWTKQIKAVLKLVGGFACASVYGYKWDRQFSGPRIAAEGGTAPNA
jgi:dynein heavy chain